MTTRKLNTVEDLSVVGGAELRECGRGGRRGRRQRVHPSAAGGAEGEPRLVRAALARLQPQGQPKVSPEQPQPGAVQRGRAEGRLHQLLAGRVQRLGVGVEQPARPAAAQGLAVQAPGERARPALRHLLHRGAGAAAGGAAGDSESLPVRAAHVSVLARRAVRGARLQPGVAGAGSHPGRVAGPTRRGCECDAAATARHALSGPPPTPLPLPTTHHTLTS